MPKWKKLLRRQASLVASCKSLAKTTRRPSPSRPAGSFESMEPRLLLSASLTDIQLASRFTDRFETQIDGVIKTISPPTTTPGANHSLSSVPSAIATNEPESIRGSRDNDLLLSYDTQGELLGRAGDDVTVVAPGTFVDGNINLVKGGGGDDTFWILAGQATVRGGAGYDIAFIGDAEVTLSGVEEVWVRDRDTWEWSLSESNRQADNLDDTTLAEITAASLLRSATTSPALGLNTFGLAALASTATNPLDGDINGDNALDQDDLDDLRALLDTAAADPALSVGLSGLNHNAHANTSDPLAQAGYSFIMFSEEAIRTRFAGASFDSSQADQLLVVTHANGQWYYHANGTAALNAFTPDDGDVLLAQLDLASGAGGNAAESLEGRSVVYEGIEAGFIKSDLTVRADVLDGVANQPG